MDTAVDLSEMRNVSIAEEYVDQSLSLLGGFNIHMQGDGASLALCLSYDQAKMLWEKLTPYFQPPKK